MSRSRKRVPGFVDRNPWAKKEANGRVRRTKDVPNGKAYRKLYCSYFIHDWRDLYFSKQEVLESYERHMKTYEEFRWYDGNSWVTEPYKYYMK